MKKHNLLSILLLLTVGVITFLACRNDRAATGADDQSRPAVFPTATSPGISSPSQAVANPTGLAANTMNAAGPSMDVTTSSTPPTAMAPAHVSTTTPVPAPTKPAVIQYTVQPGDTLLGIAVDYGVSMASVQLANNMGNSVNLIAGQTLSIPGSTQWPGESYFWTVHVVQAGDTLVGLASIFDITVDQILRVNAIADPALIHIDQQLVMPVAQLMTVRIPQPSATAAPVAAASAAGTKPAPDSSDSDTSPDLTAPTGDTQVTESPPAAAPPPSPPSGPADWPAFILARINQARAEHGLNALSIAPELTHAAQAHAEDCAGRGWGSHVGSDGAVLKTRLERSGYFGGNWGENWVQARNAERAFEWWYGEIPPNDPHRRNILSPRYTEIGIGIVETGLGYTFVTDFGRR